MIMFYIKFIDPEDVYAIYPDYDLSPDDFTLPKVCSRCGENLYLPLELPEAKITIPSRDRIIRNFEKNTYVISPSQPEFITIEFTSENKLSFDEQYRLRKFHGVSYIDSYSWSFLVDDITTEQIKHECKYA